MVAHGADGGACGRAEEGQVRFAEAVFDAVGQGGFVGVEDAGAVEA